MLLSEADIPVLVLEAQDGVSDDLRASTFHPPTLDMLAPYGLSTALVAQGLTCPTWQIRMHATGEKAEFDLGLIADRTDFPFRVQCEQAKLCALLAQRLAADGNVELRFGVEMLDLSQKECGVSVSVRLANGEAQRLESRFVIGADGANSTVRERLGLAFEGKTYPETTVLVSTTFPFQEHINGLSNVNYCWSPGGNFALLRLKDFWRCSLYYDPSLSFKAAVAAPRVHQQLREIAPNPGGYTVVDSRPYRVHQRIVSDYRVGRVLLAGDAAHVNSPSGGMGMNGGIHDAFNLVDKLAQVWRGADVTLLDLYTRQRLPVASTAISQQADRNRKRMTQKDPDARRRALVELQATVANPQAARAYLLKSSMIDGLQQAANIT
jgi:2-polyprenyl-6-methoxyphenol hydroxylase-like FAD-dependent oxidoreductase